MKKLIELFKKLMGLVKPYEEESNEDDTMEIEEYDRRFRQEVDKCSKLLKNVYFKYTKSKSIKIIKQGYCDYDRGDGQKSIIFINKKGNVNAIIYTRGNERQRELCIESAFEKNYYYTQNKMYRKRFRYLDIV